LPCVENDDGAGRRATVIGVVDLRRAAARLKCERCGKKDARLVVLDPL